MGVFDFLENEFIEISQVDDGEYEGTIVNVEGFKSNSDVKFVKFTVRFMNNGETVERDKVLKADWYSNSALYEFLNGLGVVSNRKIDWKSLKNMPVKFRVETVTKNGNATQYLNEFTREERQKKSIVDMPIYNKLHSILPEASGGYSIGSDDVNFDE